MNVEPDASWNVSFGSDRDPTGGALRRAIRVKSKNLPNQFIQLLQNLDATGPIKEDGVPRESINTGTDKRFVRRDSEGKFKESDDVGSSLAQDQKRQSNNKPKRGEGDKGDR